MTKIIAIPHDLLGLARRMQLPLRKMVGLFALNLLWIGFEGLGIAVLYPVLKLVQNGGSISSEQLSGRDWKFIHELSMLTGIPITLGALLMVSFTFLLLRQVFNYLNVYYYGVTIRHTANQVRRRAFNAFLRVQSAVQEKVRPGEIANNLTIELERALSSLFSIVRTVGVGLQMLVYLGGLLLLSPPLTTLSLVVFGVLGFLSRSLLVAVKESGRDITEANVQLAGFIVERLQHARLIRLSGTEKPEGAAFGKLSSRQAETQMRQKLITTRMSLLPEPVAIGFGYAVLFVGSQFLDYGIDKLGLFLIVLIRLVPVVLHAISDYSNIVGKWPSVEKVDGSLRELFEAREPRGGDTTFSRLDQGISYDHVSFTYGSGDTPALHDVTATILAHRMCALVGRSGAGKSTLVDLLPRLRELTAGTIRFDGIPITEFTTDSLRAGIAFVPQQPQIFNISAAEHIRYGKEGATDEEVREAARLAGALDFIEALPGGFDCPLGDGGNRLSGGQRQRLDIARALVRRAPILILDEPTSALDADAEAAFRDALRTLRSETNLTIIVIAHRLSTIADADQIVVLQQGHVESVGSHAELMAAGGWYARAHAQQRSPDSSKLPLTEVY
jgi:ATP-binding cassette, subfamily B, bacterial MsbA